jgi:dihydroorotase
MTPDATKSSPGAFPVPKLLIVRGVRVVDPKRQLDAIVDVVVENGRITRVGPDAGQELLNLGRVISGAGKWLVPAFVDLHAHLREPGQEYKEDIVSGLSAAAAGGYAHVCVMANTRPVNDSRAITEMMVARAKEFGGPALHPIGAVTKGMKGEELSEIADMREAGAVGISDDGVCVMNAAVMRRALEYAKTFDIPVIQHAEDHNLTAGATMHEGEVSARLGLRGWPRVAEDIIIARDVLLAEYIGARYHAAHISTVGAARIIGEAKSRNIPVSAEVTPHHLLLTDAAVIGYDTACRVNPPLREAHDVEALRTALADGTIDAIATDHAPHAVEEKDAEFDHAPPGTIGLETALAVVLTDLVAPGHLSLLRALQAMSTAPAGIIGAAGHGGPITPGAPANLVVFDPVQEWVVEAPFASKARNSAFLGRRLTGRVRHVVLRGGFTVFDGKATR